MMATFFKNYGELDKTVRNLLEQYKEAKTPENVVRTAMCYVLRFVVA